VAVLNELGLDVTEGMLKQDRRGGYLPPATRRGPTAVTWEPWVVRRAIYLYRLRRLGITGDLLRVLLFLRDGRQWESVRPVAHEGFTKLIHATLIPARPHRSTPRSRAHDAQDFGPIAKISGIDVGISPATAAFVWGLLLDGKPARGGTIVPLIRQLSGALDPTCGPIDEAKAKEVERLLVELRVTRENLEDAAERAVAGTADRARRRLRWLFLLVRRLVHNSMKREGVGSRSSSPLGAFGIPPKEFANELRSFPGRLTPAQLLAGLLVPLLWLSRLEESGELAAAFGGGEIT